MVGCGFEEHCQCPQGISSGFPSFSSEFVPKSCYCMLTRGSGKYYICIDIELKVESKEGLER